LLLRDTLSWTGVNNRAKGRRPVSTFDSRCKVHPHLQIFEVTSGLLRWHHQRRSLPAAAESSAPFQKLPARCCQRMRHAHQRGACDSDLPSRQRVLELVLLSTGYQESPTQSCTLCFPLSTIRTALSYRDEPVTHPVPPLALELVLYHQRQHSTPAASKDRHLSSHARLDSTVWLEASSQRLHSAEHGSLAKVAQATASLIARSEPRNGTFVKGVPVHMQDTPFTDTEPHSPEYVSVRLDGRHISAPRRLLFISPQRMS
jgi:hypothetical protein